MKHAKLPIQKKKAVTKPEFLDLCQLAIKLSRTHWEKRQGMAYHLAAVWLNRKSISNDPILHDIGGEFGSLELPDQHIAESEEGVRKRWDEVAGLIRDARL